MADNVVSNPASGGAVFATDYNASESAHWPINKTGWGVRDTDYKIVDAAGNQLPVVEAFVVTETDASLSVDAAAQTAIAAGLATKWVNIQNCSANGNILGYTFDGSTPVIGAIGTFLLLPYGSAQYVNRIPSAALKVIGSGTATIATIKYA